MANCSLATLLWIAFELDSHMSIIGNKQFLPDASKRRNRKWTNKKQILSKIADKFISRCFVSSYNKDNYGFEQRRYIYGEQLELGFVEAQNEDDVDARGAVVRRRNTEAGSWSGRNTMGKGRQEGPRYHGVVYRRESIQSREDSCNCQGFPDAAKIIMKK